MHSKIYEKIKNFFKDNYKFFIVLILLVFCFRFELPYMIYKSGGTIDLSERVTSSLDNESKGSFNMSYVTALRGSIPFILLSYIMPDWDLEHIPENYNKTLNIGKEYRDEGIDNAIIAAFRNSNYSVNITGEYVVVLDTIKRSNTTLVTGDQLVSINDYKVTDLENTKSYIASLKPGDKVAIKVINGGKEYERSATLIEENGETKIGIYLNTRYEYETEVPVDVKMKSNESGSSGGLMMALSIYDSLTSDDLTNGLTVVGTGTIDEKGNVGEIDGVKYKILAAEKKHADIFFVPEENYEEAIDTKKRRKLDVEVVKVKTLEEAIDYLEE